MAIIRTQKNVPSVYVQGSRDFQYLCRLFDIALNEPKLDADLIQYLTSTKECKNTMLTLLQTKLGFFTKKSYTDEMLRYFLAVFPDAMRYKGTLTAVTYCVNAFVKSRGIKDEIVVESDDPNNFNIIIRTSQPLTDTAKLEELLSYVLPVGLTYEFRSYAKIPQIPTEVTPKDMGLFVVADNKTNAGIRWSKSSFDTLIDKSENIPTPQYSVLYSEPDDFTTNYSSYYKHNGTKYVKLTSAETFVSGNYFMSVDPHSYDLSIGDVGLAGLSGSLDVVDERKLSLTRKTE